MFKGLWSMICHVETAAFVGRHVFWLALAVCDTDVSSCRRYLEVVVEGTPDQRTWTWAIDTVFTRKTKIVGASIVGSHTFEVFGDDEERTPNGWPAWVVAFCVLCF